MSEGPINPDREQQRADNLASRRQSHIGPLPAELDEEQAAGEEQEEGQSGGKQGAREGSPDDTGRND